MHISTVQFLVKVFVLQHFTPSFSSWRTQQSLLLLRGLLKRSCSWLKP